MLTSKVTNTVDPTDPNASGNGRKHIIRAVEASLRRLGTDYLDLYLLHTWDRITPVEEVVRTFDDLVRAGKIRYAGLSDVPAWYAARAQTFAEANALAPMINRAAAVLPGRRATSRPSSRAMAQTLGMGLTAWSPIGGGLLTGKYRRTGEGLAGDRPADGRGGARPGDQRPATGRSSRRWRAWPPNSAAAWPRWRSTGWPPSPPSAR